MKKTPIKDYFLKYKTEHLKAAFKKQRNVCTRLLHK